MEGHQEIEEATGAAFSQEQQQPELLSEEDEEYLLQESVLPVPAALPFLIAPDEYSPPPQPQPPPPSSSLIPKPTPVKKLIPVVPFVKMASPRSSLQRQLVSTAPLDAASEVAIVVHQMKEAPVAAISTPELLKGKVKSLKSAYEKTIAFKPVASAPPPPPPSEPTATEAAMVIIDSFLDSENQAPLPHLSKPVSTPQKGIREALLSPQRKTRSSLLLDSTTANTVMGSPHRDSDTTLTVMNTNINTTSTPARYSQEDKLYSSAGVGVKEFLASPALKIHPQLSAVLEQAAALSKRKSLSKQLAEEAKIVATPRIEKKAGVFGGEEDVEDEDDDELPMDQTMIDQEETLVMSYTQEEVQEQQQAEMLAFPTSSREDSFLSKTEDVDAADEALCLLEEERDLHSEASSSSSPMATTTLTPSSVSWMIVKSTLKLVFYLTLLYLGFASTFSSTSISNNNQNYCDFGPNVFMDVCIPCPENAACLEGDLTGCRDGFTFGPSTFISTVAPSKLYPVLDSFLPIFITKSSTLCVLEQEDENVSTTTTYSTSWFLSVFASSNRVSSSQISDMTWSQFFENVVDGVMGVMNGVWKFIADSISSIVSVFEKIVSLDVFGSWATKSDVMTSDSTSSSSSSSSFFFSSSSEDASSSSNERGEWTLPPPSNMYTQFQQFLAIQRENLNLLWSRWSPIIKYNMDVYAEKLRPYTEAVTRGVFSEYTSLKSRFESFIDRQYEMISTYYIALQVTETVFEFKKWVGPYALEVLFTSLAIVALAGLWVVDRSRRAADVKHSVGIMVRKERTEKRENEYRVRGRSLLLFSMTFIRFQLFSNCCRRLPVNLLLLPLLFLWKRSRKYLCLLPLTPLLLILLALH